MSCGVGHRHSLNLALLWLWRRPVAMAPIRLQAWEPPYAMGATLQNIKEKQTNRKTKVVPEFSCLHFFAVFFLSSVPRQWFPPVCLPPCLFVLLPPVICYWFLLVNFLFCGVINDGHSDRCEVVPHSSFDLHFSNNQSHPLTFSLYVSLVIC